MKKLIRILGALLAVIIGLYPLLYFVFGSKFALRASKPDWLLSNIFWNIGFYTHISAAGSALLVGWLQFNNKLRITSSTTHRVLGKIYVLAAIAGATAGILISFYATGGLVPALGFLSLGMVWLVTTLMGYTAIQKIQIKKHRNLMIYSYACCFSAVTLRLWLPILLFYAPFGTAYPIVAWLCWLPNIVVAWIIIRRTSILNSATS